MDLSVVIPAWNEAGNLAKLLPQLHSALQQLGCQYEIIVVDNHSPDETAQVCASSGAMLLQQTAPGYGGALWAGFAAARGEFILTMDADLSHTPDLVPDLWGARNDAELIIASRYVGGGSAQMPGYRHILSIILNVVYTRLLSLPVKDISSGFRLYQASVLRGLKLESTDFDALEEILIQVYAHGYQIKEIPFRYVPRDQGKSKVKLLRFGLAYLRTLCRMWKLRNSVASADYDARAYDSWIPLQRYWQRRRYDIITNLINPDQSCLDIGCGSSRILSAIGRHTVGLDIQQQKLLYCRCYDKPLVHASIFAVPFASESFQQVLCSQVIEHLPAGDKPFTEMARLLPPGGRLVLGTPDYGRISWVVIERFYKLFAPNAYADEHITHYTRPGLIQLMGQLGFRHLGTHYVLASEMILLFEKTGQEQP